MPNNSAVAFIPARSGSKRILHKNIYRLNGVPLLAYSVIAALESKIFDEVICVTDSMEYKKIAEDYGASVPMLRPKSISTDTSSDIDWLKWIFKYLHSENRRYKFFSILRPTSPFRTSETIKRAWNEFYDSKGFDSLRAVELCKQHPGKMWSINNEKLIPIISEFDKDGTPWHSMQYAALPPVFVQNASLEMALYDKTIARGSISGKTIKAFLTRGIEGFDINQPDDLILAKHLLKEESNNFYLNQ